MKATAHCQDFQDIALTRQGDDVAFTRLVERYQTPVNNLCYRMLGHPDLAEDAAQESFLRAYRSIGRFDIQRSFASWMLAIAAHYCIDLLRRRKYYLVSIHQTSDDDDREMELLDLHVANPEDELIRTEACQDVHQVLGKLKATDRAAIVLMLAEQGKLTLDDPISAYLTAGLTRGLHTLNGTDYADKLTIRHLLSHTSGLADWLEEAPENGKSLIEQMLEQGDHSLKFAEIAELMRGLKPHFPPQDLSRRKVKVRYSDTNFILIIALIETTGGQPLHQIHEDLLYKPLGLQHTYFPGFLQPLASTQSPVPLRADGQVIHIPELLKSFRGMDSTAGDTIAFLRSLSRGEVFQNPQTFAHMQSRWNRFGFPLDRAALRSPGWPIEYGLGLMCFQLPRIFTSLKRLPSVIGHTGSTGCWLFWCPEIDMFFAGSFDEVSAGAVPYRIVPNILRVLQG